MQQNAFEDIKNDLSATPIVQPYSLQHEGTVTTAASKKQLAGFFCKKDIQFLCIKKVDSSAAKVFEHRAGSTGNWLCGQMISRKLTYYSAGFFCSKSIRT